MRDNLRPGFLRSNNEPQPGLGTISGSPRCEGGGRSEGRAGPGAPRPCAARPSGPTGGEKASLQLPAAPPPRAPACLRGPPPHR